MSRLYDVEIVAKNVPKDEEDSVVTVIGDVVDSLSDLEIGSTTGSSIVEIRCQDMTKLCGGEIPEEAHKRITEAIKKFAPDAKVVTKWHYAQWDDWDDIYGEEEEEE